MDFIITPEDFKAQFPRFTPVYLPLYEYKTYNKNDIVYFNGQFYQCKKDEVTSLPTVTEDWKVYNGNVLNYTQDSDILNAIAEASVNFNQGLFGDCCTAKLVFLYLVAFYLTLDFQNAMAPMGGGGIVQSKSVGSVSESYAIPQWMLNNPSYSMYAVNGYGRKYLSLIRPYLLGTIILSKGRTTTD